MRAGSFWLLIMLGASAGLGCGGGGGGAPPSSRRQAPDAGATQASDLAFGGPSVCASGQSWSGGDDDEVKRERDQPKEDDDGSPDMLPGRACIACHARSEGPTFSIAGTVFPRGHVPDDCLPTVDEAADLAQATVVITDAAGRVLTLPLTDTGNFAQWDDGSAAIAFPITAKVVYQGREQAMRTRQRSGDCNGCHTEAGEMGAPGRITLP